MIPIPSLTPSDFANMFAPTLPPIPVTSPSIQKTNTEMYVFAGVVFVGFIGIIVYQSSRKNELIDSVKNQTKQIGKLRAAIETYSAKLDREKKENSIQANNPGLPI